MNHLTFAIPGSLDTPTGGYGYDRRVIADLRALGWQVDVLRLADSFPRPSAIERAAAAAAFAAVPAGRPILIDGLAFAVLPDEVAKAAETHPIVALIHHPLALETGLAPEAAAALAASERAALGFARQVVVTSPATARTLVESFGVDRDRLHVALPGTDRVGFASGGDGETVNLIAVGSIVPRKGHVELVEALAGLAFLPWRLTIAGEARFDPAYSERLTQAITKAGLGDRIERIGAVPRAELDRLLAAADLFVLNSSYEGYGMAYAEAIARGLPVIGTTGGAIAETVEAEAGILVPPGDTVALRAALACLISDADERGRYAEGARRAAERLPTWRDAAAIVARAIGAAL